MTILSLNNVVEDFLSRPQHSPWAELELEQEVELEQELVPQRQCEPDDLRCACEQSDKSGTSNRARIKTQIKFESNKKDR